MRVELHIIPVRVPRITRVRQQFVHLERLRDGMGALPLVVEFRSAGWVEPENL